MLEQINRRKFLTLTAAGAAGLAGAGLLAAGARAAETKLISPGCRRSKVKVARLYLGPRKALWPTPTLDYDQELAAYGRQFARLGAELADVDFAVDAVVNSLAEAKQAKDRLKDVDGVLAIHVTMGIADLLAEILGAGKPTAVFAIPYSGHDWSNFGRLQKQPLGAKLECFLTSDYAQLAAAIRPFRAIHHLREAKILNVTERSFAPYAEQMQAKFGTEMKRVDLKTVVAAYDAVADADARAETDRWIKGAQAVVEPTPENIYKCCRLALAFERMLAAEEATVLTVDCYGTMWDRTIKLPAYPCLGFCRLNDLGYGGICESDLRCAMTHILLQGLTGKPGFISDPTIDEASNSIILAHCMGARKMDGPSGPTAPYKLRTVHERQEGVTTQSEMRKGQAVTQAILIGSDLLLYFTGRISEVPVGLEYDRGCRTKIKVQVDGDVTTLWQNWSNGLHRQTVYGHVTKELGQFCRYMGLKLVDEAARA